MTIRFGIFGIGRRQRACDILDLTDLVRDTDPDVRIFVSVAVGDQTKVAARIDHLEVGARARYFIKERFHTRAVDDHYVGTLERLDILGCQLVVVQTTDLRLSQADDLDTGDIFRQLQSIDIHRIKARHDGETCFFRRSIGSRRTTADEADEHKKRYQ